jgi:hypothetical protein
MTTAAVALLLQSITWLYANDLSAGAAFLGATLGLPEVRGLVQRDRCRVFRATNVSVVSVGSVGFVGVCNTRAAPVCDGYSNGSSRGGTQAVTFTLVLGGRAAVDAAHAALLPRNGSDVLLTRAGGGAARGAYGFDAYDVNTTHGLGCYRMEVVQSFDNIFDVADDDPAWPSPPPPPPAAADPADPADPDELRQLRDQLRRAGVELEAAEATAGPTPCACADFCSGRCFAAGCSVCPASTWDDDEASCLSAGPLGHGLLCAPGDEQAPCCSPNGTACQLVGRQWCDCSKYPPESPLFPPLSNRSWAKAQGCKSVGASLGQRGGGVQ